MGISIELSEKDLAYIILTSGTTGQPKGVQIGREATFNLMKWMTSQLKLSSKTAFMNQAPFAFDLLCMKFLATSPTAEKLF